MINKGFEKLAGITREERRAIATRAGTTLGYLEQLIWNKVAKPSIRKAMQLDKASNGVIKKEKIRSDIDWTLFE